MPVSSPSYFPPAGGGGQVVGTTAGNGATGVRTFLAGANAGKFTEPVNDLIVIGDNADSGGTVGAPITDTNLAGLIVIGSQAFKACVAAAGNFGASFNGPSTVVGFNCAPLLSDSNSNTFFGSNQLTSYVYNGSTVTPNAANVVVGEQASANLSSGTAGSYQGYVRNVHIGFNCASGSSVGAPQNKGFADNVIIGYKAVSGVVSSGVLGGPQVSQNVVIGSQAASLLGNVNSGTGSAKNVLIGYAIAAGGDANNNVQVGYNITGGGTFNTTIGESATGGSDSNVVIGGRGAGRQLPGSLNSRCVAIGAGAGFFGDTANDQFLLETYDGATRRTLMYGLFGQGSPAGIVVGFSSPATNRDLPGFNILKLLNGTVTGVAPVGGGFFYSLAGRLHWVDTGNVDWVLTGTAAGQLASSLTGFTNNAAAAAGTLTNAPVAGNPTKWIPINDNGTIRNVPAW